MFVPLLGVTMHLCTPAAKQTQPSDSLSLFKAHIPASSEHAGTQVKSVSRLLILADNSPDRLSAVLRKE